MVGVKHMDPESLLEGLDESQRRAAVATSGPVRIIAGAGAGKTRTITRRIAYACALDVWNPSHVLAVTFSKRAAQEMHSRLDGLGFGDVKARTFHSAALGQLHLVWDAVTTDAFPEVHQSSPKALAEAVRIVTNRTDLDKGAVLDVESEINWAKVSLIAPQDYPTVCKVTGRVPPAGLEPDIFAEIAQEYERQKAAANRMDFNDILLLVCHIIERFPRQARRIRGGIDCITVDEYQDVSPLQHRLLRLWLGDINEVCVVGDAAQTIYSFAGATSYYLRDFAREFAPVHSDIVLNRDYRSTPQIVQYANRVLAASPHHDEYLELTSAQPKGRDIRPMRYENDSAEAQGIAARIKRLQEHGVPLGDIGVLTRTNAQLKPIAKALEDRGIASSVRKVEFTDGNESETTPQDGDWASAGMSGNAPSGSNTPSDTMAAPSPAAPLTPAAGTISASSPSTPTAVAAQRRMAAEEQALAQLTQLRQQGSATTMPARQTVSLSTIHAAKGLEWKYVFVAGCADGLIPYHSPTDESEREEERRLMYVAVTRAQKELFPSYASTDASSTGYAAHERMLSPFLRGK